MVKQAKAQFAIRNITGDNTEYAYIVAALDQDTASCVLDLLSNPPEESKHEAIKSRLLRTYGLSHRVRANRLLQLDDLGDRKPSALMDEMWSLLDGYSPCLLFEQLFINRMPDPIRLQPLTLFTRQAVRSSLPDGHRCRSKHFPGYPVERMKHSPNKDLTVANGTRIPTYGQKTIALHFSQ